MSAELSYNAMQSVIERVIARAVMPPDPQHGQLVHLQWFATLQADRLVQIYANGQLIDHSASSADRDAWLLLPAEEHTQIELLAVAAEYASVPLQGLLAGYDPPTQPVASLALLRDYALPVGTVLCVQSNAQPHADCSPLFSQADARGGFGAVFGEGGFGFEASVGPGLGYGELGYGPLGIDGDALRWREAGLADGPHTLTLSINDSAGNAITTELDIDITIRHLPAPPTNLAFSDDLILSWN